MVEQSIGVGVIGFGKFATMFAAQCRHSRFSTIKAIADLQPKQAQKRLQEAGWTASDIAAVEFLGVEALIGSTEVDVVVEATGDAVAGVAHALMAIEQGKHIIMVNVEADVLCGPALAKRAHERGVHYSMAYGDQPALIAELVAWAETCGFTIVAAGKGTKYLPKFHCSTPDTVWQHYGLTETQALASGMNAKMFNSFLDGTKSAIEMVAVANACSLDVPVSGLSFPPCGADDLQHLLRPEKDGGILQRRGVVEVVSSLERDQRPVHRDLRWGVFVVIEAPNAYTARCFSDYGLKTDDTGRFACLYRPYHMIGLELGVSIEAVGRQGRATGQAKEWRGDAVAVAKSDLQAGTKLDGEGGYHVYGRAVPASQSAAHGYLPIGLAANVRLKHAIGRDEFVKFDDVEDLCDSDAWRMRQLLEPVA